MVEGGAAEATEADVIDALMFAHKTAQPILELIERMRAAVGKPKRDLREEDAARRRRRDASQDLSTRSILDGLAHQGEEGPLRRLQGHARPRWSRR